MWWTVKILPLPFCSISNIFNHTLICKHAPSAPLGSVLTGTPTQKKASRSGEFIVVEKNVHNFVLGLLDEFCGYFWMLPCLDLLAAEIHFSMMFKFSLVYVSVFGNRHISSLSKILITPN